MPEQLTTIKELETPVKVSRFLYFYDILFIGVYAFIMYKILCSHVYSKISALYLINCILWGIFMICPAVGNFKRKNWQNIINTYINIFTGKTYMGPREEDADEDEEEYKF